jgi:hypothetical protein
MILSHLLICGGKRKPLTKIGVALLTEIREKGIYQVFKLIRLALRPFGLGAFLLP